MARGGARSPRDLDVRGAARGSCEPTPARVRTAERRPHAARRWRAPPTETTRCRGPWPAGQRAAVAARAADAMPAMGTGPRAATWLVAEIGRASCRERVWRAVGVRLQE